MFRNIEGLLAILAKAGLMLGMESEVESWVSVLEHHNNPVRPLSQERLHAEGMVAINGPAVVHCDAIVEEAMKTYWSQAKKVEDQGGHWIRRDKDIRSYTVSKSVDSLVNTKPAVPFMI